MNFVIAGVLLVIGFYLIITGDRWNAMQGSVLSLLGSIIGFGVMGLPIFFVGIFPMSLLCIGIGRKKKKKPVENAET